MTHALRTTVFGCAVLAAVACSGDNLTVPDPTQPSQLVIVGGGNQAGSVGSVLADPLIVRVLDGSGGPVAGRQIYFALGANAAGGEVTPDTVRTDSDGRASAQWILGSASGTQSVQARVVGAEVLAVTFTAVAGTGSASQLQGVRGDGQSATAGSTLPDSLVVRTLDSSGLPIAGVTVTWSVTGGGSVSAPSTVTGPDGRTGVRRTLGEVAGEQTTIATVEGLSGSPVTFTATALVGAAGRLRLEVQPASGAKSGLAFSRQPQVQLIDASGNAVQQAGIAINASIASGPSGATLIGSTTASTNTQGLAAFTNLGISGGPGTYALNFGGSNVTGVTSNSISLSAGDADRLVIVQQPPSTSASGAILAPAPSVRLRDAAGNFVLQSGVSISVAVGSGNATVGGTTAAVTNSTGTATFSNLTLTGSGDIRLIFASAGLTTATSNVVQLDLDPDKGASSIAAPSELGAGVNGTVTVTVRAANGTALSGRSVTLSSSGSGNTIAPATATTNASGEASFTFQSTKLESKSLTATVSGVTIGPVTVVVTAGPADAAHTIADVPNGRRFRTTVITVTTRDQFDNDLSTGGANISAAVSKGPNAGILITVTDLNNGKYEVRYTPVFSGDDEITIQLDGQKIKGSPFKSDVRN